MTFGDRIVAALVAGVLIGLTWSIATNTKKIANECVHTGETNESNKNERLFTKI